MLVQVLHEAPAPYASVLRTYTMTIHTCRDYTIVFPHQSQTPLLFPEAHPFVVNVTRLLVRANWHAGGWRQALATLTQHYILEIGPTSLTAHQRMAAKAAGICLPVPAPGAP